MEAILFDFDGTLVDSMPVWAEKILSILNRRGISYESDLLRILTPKGDKLSAEYMIEQFGVKESVPELLKEMDEYAIPRYENEVPAKEGVREYLEYLKKKGVRMGVLTASPHRIMQPCLRHNGLIDYFDFLWTGEEDFGMSKADPEIYRIAAKRLGTTVDQLAFADDNVLAVRAAKEAGVYTIGVSDASSAADEERIRQIADVFIVSMTELIKD